MSDSSSPLNPVSSPMLNAGQGTTTSVTTPLPRYRRAAERAGTMLLTARDRAVLEDVWRMGLLTTSQIETLRGYDPDARLRFVSRFTLTQRLKLLFHHRYLQRVARPLAAGSLEPVYLLDTEGARVLAAQHGEVRAKSPSRLPKPVALEHLLGIVALRVALTVASATNGSNVTEGETTNAFRLLQWRDGDKVRFCTPVESAVTSRAGNGRANSRRDEVSIIPDAALIFSIGHRPRYAFVEVDRGTEGALVLRSKLRAYLAYLQGGGFARDWGVEGHVPFWVLFVVPTQRRAQVLLEAAAHLARIGSASESAVSTVPVIIPVQMFRVALEADMTPEMITGPVWWQGHPFAQRNHVGQGTTADESRNSDGLGERGAFWKLLPATSVESR